MTPYRKIHNINEDYDRYVNRVRKENISNFFAVALLIFGVGIIIFITGVY